MNNNKNAFELGQQRAETLNDIETLDSEASDSRVDQYNIKAYFAGVFAGLNQRLGRLQRTYDLDLEAGNDDHAIAVEQTLEQTYALISDFAARYLF